MSFSFKKNFLCVYLAAPSLSYLWHVGSLVASYKLSVTACRLLITACICAKLLQLCPPLCKTVDCSLQGSSVQGILQARILEWVAMPTSRGFSQPKDGTQDFCIAGGFFTAEPPGKPLRVNSLGLKVLL